MIILGTNSIKETGFDVANSCRFNGADNAYMHKTPGSAGNRKKFTISCWIKKVISDDTNGISLFSAYTASNDAGHFNFNINNSEKLDVTTYSTTLLATNRLFRDTSAWYHLVCAVDTTLGTANNRVRLYVNGTEETSFATRNNPSQDADFQVNNTVRHSVGVNWLGDVNETMNGYMAEMVFIDNAQLAPDQFGEFDSDSGIWKPIDVSGLTFGTNGFYLDFEDSANLGNDANGGTDLTEVNLTATDQSTDTCTNNFATTNPLLHGGTVATLSEGNLKLSTGASWKHGIPTIGVSSGKWYMETKIGSMGEYYGGGVIDSYEINSWGASGSSYAGQKTLSIGYYSSGTKYIGDSSSSYGASYTTGDIVSTAIDLDAGTPTVTFYKNGASQGAVNLPTSSNSTGLWFFMPSLYNGTLELNFGSPPYSESGGETDGDGFGNFAHSVPSGHFSLNTKNLAEYG